MRALAIVASVPRAGERAELPHSDRAALALARARFGGAARACALDAFARRYARAAGFAQVSAELDAELDGAEVVLVGRGACGDRGDAFPAQLAERLGAALAYEVIEVRAEAQRLAVERDLGRGARDRLAVEGRAVLAIAESAPRGRYVSRHRIDAARGAADERGERGQQDERGERGEHGEHDEHDERDARGERSARAERDADATGAGDWRPVSPRVRLRDGTARSARPAVERMNALFGIRAGGAEPTGSLVRGSAEECARQLIRYLRHHGFIECAPAEAGPGAPLEWAAARTSGAARSADVARPSGVAHASEVARDVAAARPLSARVRRRPRPVGPGAPAARAMRGPFECGVDLA